MALSDLLLKSTITLNLDSQSSSDVIQHLGSKLLDAGLVKASFVNAALEREKIMPTGLPLGGTINAAIPHTDVEHVYKAGVAMATLTQPVTFQNMVNPTEGVEVRIVFLLALDQPKSQIEMLQEIAGVLQNPNLIEGLVSAKSIPEALQLIKDASSG